MYFVMLVAYFKLFITFVAEIFCCHKVIKEKRILKVNIAI